MENMELVLTAGATILNAAALWYRMGVLEGRLTTMLALKQE